MTKKDYEVLARAISSALDWANTADEPMRRETMKLATRNVALNVADELETDNPRFKRDVFLRACGVQ